jgi:hypothetical protein
MSDDREKLAEATRNIAIAVRALGTAQIELSIALCNDELSAIGEENMDRDMQNAEECIEHARQLLSYEVESVEPGAGARVAR